MKKRLYIAAFILLLLILREAGGINLNWYTWKPEWTYTMETAFHETEANQLRFEEDDGRAFTPKISNSDDSYHVVVRYHFDESLTWTRWIPFWKSGNNAVQLIYSVWLGQQLAGSGHVTLTGHQSAVGICSAREYRELLRQPVVNEMHRQVEKKVHIFKR